MYLLQDMSSTTVTAGDDTENNSNEIVQIKNRLDSGGFWFTKETIPARVLICAANMWLSLITATNTHGTVLLTTTSLAPHFDPRLWRSWLKSATNGGTPEFVPVGNLRRSSMTVPGKWQSKAKSA